MNKQQKHSQVLKQLALLSTRPLQQLSLFHPQQVLSKSRLHCTVEQDRKMEEDI